MRHLRKKQPRLASEFSIVFWPARFARLTATNTFTVEVITTAQAGQLGKLSDGEFEGLNKPERGCGIMLAQVAED